MGPGEGAAVRIAVSSSTFRRPLADGELTQLEWLERCASALGVDGVLADVADFPRSDAEYVAQLRKIAIDAGIVPFGIDGGSLFEPGADAVRDDVLALASGFGAAIVRAVLPPPGDVPPATFVETSRVAKSFGRAAKLANVTIVIATAPGTLGEDDAGVKHLLKDADSAWLRACPSALLEPSAKDRVPAFTATPADHAVDVVARAGRAWLILDASAADDPWGLIGGAVAALRHAEAERRIATRRSSSSDATRPQRPS